MLIDDLLRMTTARGASDLHLKAGSFPVLRINGELIAQEDMSLITGDTRSNYR